MTPASFTYLGLHEGIPYFFDALRHGDARFLFSGSGMSDPDFIMSHGSWIIMYILHSDFQFSNFRA